MSCVNCHGNGGIEQRGNNKTKEKIGVKLLLTEQKQKTPPPTLSRCISFDSLAFAASLVIILTLAAYLAARLHNTPSPAHHRHTRNIMCKCAGAQAGRGVWLT
jgi:hypothetical protein